LPDGQFGNSEVGHLTLGSGRILEQELLRIVNAIYDGEVARNPVWQDMLQDARSLHLVGMVSDGGVHSHIEHLFGLLDMLQGTAIEPVLHMITDGRDTAPRAALRYLDRLEEKLAELGSGRIATVSGRYCAMDRARHWDRTKRAWDCMVRGEGMRAESPRDAIEQAYERGEGDEFIQPTVIDGYRGMDPDVPVLFFNFRSDRVRQLAAAFGLESFDAFERNGAIQRRLVCMTEYDASYPFPELFTPQTPRRVLAEVISEAGLRQLHCAETEKYPHVTYFFNGGREKPFPGEDRIIVPSPEVATYDMLPEMSAPKVANELIDAIERDAYDFIITNFANTDMVGHTARQEPVIRAVETIDNESHRVFRVALQRGWRILLTADHGNCDEMVNPLTGEPHTQHTEYPVPLLLMGAGPVRLGTGRGLADIAPTILDLLGLPRPPEMTGRSLILKEGLL
jgi:2,3-bisphosphoglycerate-independent phosphoglycerate mutase